MDLRLHQLLVLSSLAEALSIEGAPDIAYCITGQPRGFQLPKVWKSIKHNAIDALGGNISDVFFHISLESGDNITAIINLYYKEITNVHSARGTARQNVSSRPMPNLVNIDLRYHLF